MTRFLLLRISALAFRLCVAGLLLLAVMEVSFALAGGTGRHVWLAASWEPPPAAPEAPLAPEAGWPSLLAERSGRSLAAAGAAWGAALLVGMSWGVLAARFRRWRAALWIGAPFSAAACVPGFWIAVLAASWSLHVWGRPGYAGELAVESGPDLLSWWNLAVVSLPPAAVAAGMLVRRVSAVLERECALPGFKGLHLSGWDDGRLFYGYAFRRALPSLLTLADRPLPLVLGGLAVMEWAFRYEGVGALFIDSVHAGHYGGVLLSGMWMAAVLAGAALLRECAVRLAGGNRPSP